MRRFKALILILVAVLAVTVVFAKGQELEDVRYGDLKALAEGLKIDIAKLAGDDDRLGELEAYKLLEWMKQENRWQLAVHAYLASVRWTDEQIGEMVYITALFALLNRVADAFGIVAPIMEDMSGSHSGEPA